MILPFFYFPNWMNLFSFHCPFPSKNQNIFRISKQKAHANFSMGLSFLSLPGLVGESTSMLFAAITHKFIG